VAGPAFPGAAPVEAAEIGPRWTRVQPLNHTAACRFLLTVTDGSQTTTVTRSGRAGRCVPLLPARRGDRRLLDRDGVPPVPDALSLGWSFAMLSAAHRDQASRVQLHEQVTSHPGCSDMLNP
jgi:hypothetical protein